MTLEKPGAGLPEFERLVIKRGLVPIARTLFSWNIAVLLIRREIAIIKKLVNEIPKEKRVEQNIIDRTFAIEDDTRRFSINMVLEHLVIAGGLVQDVIKTLSDEKEYQGDIKIENVKPSKNSINYLDDFEKFYEEYILFIKSLPKKQSKAKKRHPWFVNFNNYDWSVFMFMHTFIHRRQIQAIIKKLGEKNE